MLDLEPIRERVTALDLKSWWEIVETVTCEDFAEVGVFVANAPADIAALIEEVERLRTALDDTKAALQDTEDDLCEARERLNDLDIDL